MTIRSKHRRVVSIACGKYFWSSTADVARPSALREASERGAPSSLDSFLSLVLQPLPPDDAERRVPDRETVRPGLERTDSPALVPSGFRFSPEQPGFGTFPLCPSDISPASGGNPKVVRGRASAVWLAFVGGAGICSAPEHYSDNGLRNRVSAAFRPVFSDVSQDLWWAPPAGRVLATPCRPARCRTLFNFFAASLKGCARPLSTRRFFFSGRWSDGPRISAYLLLYHICCGYVKCLVSEPGITGICGLAGFWLCVNPLRSLRSASPFC